jgi:hypothetical protein
METLTAAMIATLLLTRMTEKLGEKVGEKLPDLGAKVWEQVGNLKQKLWHNDPDTARAIELVTYQPELVQQQPQDYGIEVLVEKMELAAKDPDLAQIIEALVAEVKPQLPSKVVNNSPSSTTATAGHNSNAGAASGFTVGESGTVNIGSSIKNN